METQILFSIRKLVGVCITVAAAFTVLTSHSYAQVVAKPMEPNKPTPARITEWEDPVTGAMHLVHVMFPDLNPRSKMIIVDNRDWGHSAGGMIEFGIDICEPDFPTRNAEIQQDVFSRYDVQCSILSLDADLVMTTSQIGPVPSLAAISRPAVDKKWKELAALLEAHPEWSEAQVADAMKASGVQVGANNRNAVYGLVSSALPKLEPFFGRLAVDSIEYASPKVLTDKSLSRPEWIVQAHPLGQDNTKPSTNFTFTFSVFDGGFEGSQSFVQMPEPSGSK